MLKKHHSYSVCLLIILTLTSTVCTAGISFLRPPDYQSYYASLPEFSTLPTLDLSGEWQYRIQKEGKWKKVQLPSSWEGYSGRVTFRKNFTLDPSFRGKSVKLIMMGVSRRCVVSLNGNMISESAGPLVEVRFPDRLVLFGERNQLEVMVDNEISPLTTIPLKTGELCPMNYGGLTGDIFLSMESLPAVEGITVFTDVSSDLKTGRAVVSFEIDRPLIGELSGTAGCKIFDPSGRTTAETRAEITELDSMTFSLDISEPKLWSPAAPNIYKLQVWLETPQGGFTVHHREIGFKQFTADSVFRLNGDEMKIRGIAYWETGEYGLTFRNEDYSRDIQLLQFAGANAVLLRRPAHPRLLQLCDSAGILVFQCTELRGVPTEVFKRKDFSLRAGAHLQAVVNQESFHPAIGAWVLGTGLEDDFPAERLLEYISEYDSHPALIGIAGEPAKLTLAVNSTEQSPILQVPMDLGPLMKNSSEESQPLYAAELSRTLSVWKESGGIFLRNLTDWEAGRVILFQDLSSAEGIFISGLVERGREPRIAYRRLQEGWFSTAPGPVSAAGEPEPLEFPIAGFALLTAVVLYLRANKVFRGHLRRIFVHPHGFFQDIRNRRYIQTSETLFVGVCSALVLSIIISALLHRLRLSEPADYIIAHLFQGLPLHTTLKNLIWRPVYSIVVMFSLIIIFYLAAVLFIKITAVFLNRRTTIGQCFALVFWVNSLFLWLTPVTVFFYRGLYLDFIMPIEIGLTAVFIVLVFFRAVNGARVTCGKGYIKMLLIFIIAHASVLSAIFLYFQHRSAIYHYWEYFLSAVV